MWQLSLRTDHPTPKTWQELGGFASICEAARRIATAENSSHPGGDAIFFRIYCWHPEGHTDADILGRLEYQGRQGLYVLQRGVH